MAEAEEINHRKLIRPSLTAMKEQLGEERRRKAPQRKALQRNASQRNAPQRNAPHKNSSPRAKRSAPADHTNAESFYFLKQMQNQTPMVLVLTDGEEVHGTIEWYDRACVKIRRGGGANLLIYKDSIKYLYKAAETATPGPQETAPQEAAQSNGSAAAEAASTDHDQ